MKELKGFQLVYKPFQVVCRAGEESNDLYYVESGKLLVCSVSGTKVIALAHVGLGEFVGELSFFDGKPRASHVIALEPSKLTILSQEEILPELPKWYVGQAMALTKHIRLVDHIVGEANLRRFESQKLKPLTIDEQRYVLQALNQKD